MREDEMAGNGSCRGSPGPKRVLLHVAVFVTGFSVMAVEVAGTRVVAPWYGTDVYTWSALIAVTLGGLSLGYALGGILAERSRPGRAFILSLIGAAVAVCLIPLYANTLMAMLLPLGQRLGLLIAAISLFAIPLTLCGAVIPIALKLLAEDETRVCRAAGMLYAASTLGSIGGTIGTGFFLLPALGVKAALLMAGGLLAVTACVIGVLVTGNRRSSFVALFAYGLAFAAVAWPRPDSSTYGNLAFVTETQSTYGHLVVADSPFHRFLFVNGILQTGACREPDLASAPGTLLRSGDYIELLPCLSTKGRRLLLIGLGGGTHATILSRYGIDVDCVEIDPEIARIARQYFGFKGSVEVTDGRHFVSRTDRKYDYVVIDVFAGETVPFHLYTREMYSACRTAFADPESILAVHHIGCPGDAVTLSIGKTLRDVFKHVTAYRSGLGGEIQMIYFFASDAPLRLDEELMRRFGYAVPRPMALDPDAPAGVVYTDDLAPIDSQHASTARRWRMESRLRFGMTPVSQGALK